MRFVQFRSLDDSQETIRVGIQNVDNGTVLDLTEALDQPINLANALAKLGSQGVIDAAATAAARYHQHFSDQSFSLLPFEIIISTTIIIIIKTQTNAIAQFGKSKSAGVGAVEISTFGSHHVSR
jgi:hypothetical protein